MEIEKQVLSSSERLELYLPKDGFSDEFLADISRICKKDQNLDSAYLVLKNTNGDSSLLFAFYFSDEMVNELNINKYVTNIMSKILALFKDEIVADAICLNGKRNLQSSIASITAPFYER